MDEGKIGLDDQILHTKQAINWEERQPHRQYAADVQRAVLVSLERLKAMEEAPSHCTPDPLREDDNRLYVNYAKRAPKLVCLEWPDAEVRWYEPRETLNALLKLLADERKKSEQLQMQLAACGVVALSNTPESAALNRDMHPDYWSASCEDVAAAVDREMSLRAKLEDA